MLVFTYLNQILKLKVKSRRDVMIIAKGDVYFSKTRKG